MHSVMTEQPQFVTMLLCSGAKVNVVDYSGDTPLSKSIKMNNDTISTILIQQGADSNIADKKGEAPLSLAINQGMERHGWKRRMTNGIVDSA